MYSDHHAHGIEGICLIKKVLPSVVSFPQFLFLPLPLLSGGHARANQAPCVEAALARSW